MNLRAAVAEFVGTAFLLLAVVGSGIMAERLCGGNIGLALFANAVATGGALVALMSAFGPVSGAHFNPVVTLATALRKNTWSIALPYAFAQILGALAGTAIANLIFGLHAFAFSHHERSGSAMLVSEFVATFGLLAVIWGSARSRPLAAPYAVAAYIVGAYWFSPSTSFANPAVTIARSLTDTFSGIRPADAPAFIGVQVLGALAATALFGWFELRADESVVISHPEAACARGERMRPSVLFVCRHNTGRSQMAEAYLRHFMGDMVDVASAGTVAADVPDPCVVAVMAEDGIDISAARPKLLDAVRAAHADRIVTMGCDVEGVSRIDDDWRLPDPKGQPPDRVREIRDAVKGKAQALAAELLAHNRSHMST